MKIIKKKYRVLHYSFEKHRYIWLGDFEANSKMGVNLKVKRMYKGTPWFNSNYKLKIRKLK